MPTLRLSALRGKADIPRRLNQGPLLLAAPAPRLLMEARGTYAEPSELFKSERIEE
jgi:hypothetical protein